MRNGIGIIGKSKRLQEALEARGYRVVEHEDWKNLSSSYFAALVVKPLDNPTILMEAMGSCGTLGIHCIALLPPSSRSRFGAAQLESMMQTVRCHSRHIATNNPAKVIELLRLIADAERPVPTRATF